jgi:hypothetical protein
MEMKLHETPNLEFIGFSIKSVVEPEFVIIFDRMNSKQ